MPERDWKQGVVERRCLVILTILAILYTLYFARAILLPATLAVMLSLVLKPVTHRLAAMHIPPPLSAVFILAVSTALAIAAIGSLWIPARDWLDNAPQSLQKFREQLNLEGMAGPLANIQRAKSEVDEMTSVPGETSPLEVRIEQPSLANQVINTTGGFATGIAIAAGLLFFLVAAGDRFLEKTVEILPTWREKREAVAMVREIQAKISTYLGTITIINIGLGIVIGTGLWLIEMPNPLLWGVLAALFNFIPFAGLVLGTCIVTVIAIAELPTLGQALLAPAIYLAANGIEANFVTPAVLGQSVSLNPVVILLAIFIGGWIWGIGGIFLAVPILLVLKIACDNYESLKPVGIFLAR